MIDKKCKKAKDIQMFPPDRQPFFFDGLPSSYFFLSLSLFLGGGGSGAPPPESAPDLRGLCIKRPD